MFPVTRMRRMRSDERIRSMFRETSVDISDFIYPLYIKESTENGNPEEISTMPGQYRYSVDDAVDFAGLLEDDGLTSVILFGIPDYKDEKASSAYDKNGIIQQTIKALKEQTNLVVLGDVCMCEYTDHGHYGIIKDNYVQNDETLKYLSKIAVSYADAGVDVVAPSDMMDGRVGAIREALDKNDIEEIKKEKDALQETLYKLAAKVYENTNASNNTTTEEKTEDKKDDSVKDAEFEEK